MFGIGVSELLVIFLVALLVLGPDRLPAAARTLAKLFGEFRKATDDLRTSLVGISDLEPDWRREHNNPRIIETASMEKTTASEQEVAAPTDPEVVARVTEKTHG